MVALLLRYDHGYGYVNGIWLLVNHGDDQHNQSIVLQQCDKQ